MKKIYKLLSVTALVTAISSNMVLAQEDVADLIKSSPADATKLANAYLQPLFKGFGTGLTQGWYNTGKPKGTGRFDLRVSASLAIVPTSAQSYDVTKLGLSNRVSVKSGGNIAQTGSGFRTAGPTLSVKNDTGQELESFALPQGSGFNYVPAPQLQATIGLPKGIDLSLRYVPSVKLGDEAGEVKMIGGGLRLDVLPLITKAGKLLPFNLAVAAGYTKINYSLGLNVPPPSATQATASPASDATKDFTTQRISAEFKGFNVDAILSKKLLFFTPYVSVGFSNGKTDVGLLGNYPIISGGTVSGPASAPVIAKTYTVFTDPIRIKETSISGVRGAVGFQMSLAILKIYGSYNVGEYNSVNAGIGLGF